MDDIDIVVASVLGDPHRAQDSEGVSNRYVEFVFGREEIESMLPIARRPERDKYVMAALLEAPA